jgi:hypothetical protein
MGLFLSEAVISIILILISRLPTRHGCTFYRIFFDLEVIGGGISPEEVERRR